MQSLFSWRYQRVRYFSGDISATITPFPCDIGTIVNKQQINDRNHNLTELYLYDYGMGDNKMQKIAEEPYNHPSLQHLGLAGNI